MNITPYLGFNLSIFYIIFAYFLPLSYSLLPISFSIPIQTLPLGLHAGVYLASAIFCIFLVAKTRIPDIVTSNETNLPLPRLHDFYCYARPLLSLLFLVASITIVSHGMADFRYSSESKTSTFSVLLLIALKPWSLADLLIRVLNHEPKTRTAVTIVGDVSIALGWLISIDGLASSIVAAFAVYFSLVPTFFRRYIIESHFSNTHGFWKHAFALIILAVLALACWQIGHGVKYKSTDEGQSVEEIQSTDQSQSKSPTYALWIPQRLSVPYYAFTMASEMNSAGQIDHKQGWRIIGQNLAYRFGAILQLPVERPDVRSIAQLNYYNMMDPAFANDRSGSSPGALGSFSYLAPVPIDIILGCIYLVAISIFLTRYSTIEAKHLSFPGLAILYYLSRSLYLNPADFLIVLNTSVVFLVSFVVIGELTRIGRRSRVSGGRPTSNRA
jgi:hypothetical protein|tara:strand:+ start:99 stop:1424 length:1326 start_codon:yes stop_codon:yes gene_type:complete